MSVDFSACLKAKAESAEFKSVTGSRQKEVNRLFDSHYNANKENGMSDLEASRAAARQAAEDVKDRTKARTQATFHELNRVYDVKTAIDEGRLEDAVDLISGSDRSATLINVENQETVFVNYIGQDLEAAIARNFAPGVTNIAPGTRAPRMRRSENFVRDIFEPGSTKDPASKAAAEGVQAAFKPLRSILREMGIVFPTSKVGHYLPQIHSRAKMVDARNYKKTKQEWIDNHQNWVDWDVMRHADDGRVILASERNDVLSKSYDNIVKNGLDDGANNISARYSHERFIHYKDADSWLAANAKYGEGDVWSQVTSTIQLMARDAAIVSVLGPNPDAMAKFVARELKSKAHTLRENEKAIPRALKRGVSEGGQADFQRMLQYKMQGNPELNLAGSFLAGTRNLLTSSLLGGAYIPALFGDNFLAMHNSLFNRMRGTKHIKNYLGQMNPLNSADRRLAIRAGFTAEANLRVAVGAQRFMGEITGPNITRILTNSVLRASLLSPHTRGNRGAHGMDMAGAFADARSTKFNDLPFRNTLAKYGITEREWDIFRATKVQNHKGARYLFPVDLMRRTDADDAFEVGNKFMNMMEREMTFGTPESSARARFFLVGDAQPGTFRGEALRSGAMFKTFAATIMFEHIRRGIGMGVLSGKGSAYIASFFIGMTIAGAFSQQARQIANGRDPMDMTKPQFWGSAAMLGGGMGFLGDFMFSQLNRYGSSMGEMAAGPVFSFFNDAMNLTAGNAIQAIQGEDTKIGREAVRFLQRYMPGTSLWYAKNFLRGAIFDQLALMVDPQAASRARRYERQVQRDRNQNMFWKFGQPIPGGGPDLSAAIGGSR